ncbi:MAG: peptide chain release factor N(5)-glutamine methyltransferase [Leptospiraceae bacterium]|nr:peptide chain release factor N(5)-glutamine methyltransferase [Leptospiraceae bacterium]MDW7975848.1 HemK/PrmC family methyltransferase [Leptospiraceae bacterium]
MKISLNTLWQETTKKLSQLDDPKRESYYLIKNFFSLDERDFLLPTTIDVSLQSLKEFYHKVELRKRNYPFAYLFRKKEFFSLEFYVDEQVLIPRPETELLVEFFLNEVKQSKEKILCLDIGTGSGCIAISAIKHTNEQVCFIGIDISKSALKVAKKNKEALLTNKEKKRLKLMRMDFLTEHQKLSKFSFDYILSNPPYVLKEEVEYMNKETFYEPEVALFVENPIWFYQIFFKNSLLLLKEKGKVFLETSPSLISIQIEILRAFPQVEWEIKKDYQQQERFLFIKKF